MKATSGRRLRDQLFVIVIYTQDLTVCNEFAHELPQDRISYACFCWVKAVATDRAWSRQDVAANLIAHVPCMSGRPSRRFLQCKHRLMVAVTTSCHSGSSPSTLIFRMWYFFWQSRQGFVAFFELIVEVYKSGTLKLFSRGFSLIRPSSHWAQNLLFLSSPFFQNPPHFSTNQLFCSISTFSDSSVRSTVYLLVRKI